MSEEILEEVETEEDEEAETQEAEGTEYDLDSMSFAELKALAAELGVTTTGLRSKAAYIAAISAFLAGEEEEEEEEDTEVITLVYIGPSIPRQRLSRGNSVTGTRTEIDAYLKGMQERFPELKYLMVPPEKLAGAMQKVKRRGNILHKYYEDMAARAKVLR